MAVSCYLSKYAALYILVIDIYKIKHWEKYSYITLQLKHIDGTIITVF